MEENSVTVHRSSEQINSLIEEWKQSDLSKKSFCDQKGIKYLTFIGWISRRQKSKKNQEKFVPLKIEGLSQNSFAEIQLSNSRKIVLHQAVGVEILQAILKC